MRAVSVPGAEPSKPSAQRKNVRSRSRLSVANTEPETGYNERKRKYASSPTRGCFHVLPGVDPVPVPNCLAGHACSEL